MKIIDKIARKVEDCESGDVIEFGYGFCIMSTDICEEHAGKIKVVNLENGEVYMLDPVNTVKKIYTATLTVGE